MELLANIINLLLLLSIFSPIQFEQSRDSLIYEVPSPELIDIGDYEQEQIELFLQASDFLPLQSRVMFFGKKTDIPTGFSRDTNFDNKFIQIDNNTFTVPVNGGSGTHSHTLDQHPHDGTLHTHTISAGRVQGFAPNDSEQTTSTPTVAATVTLTHGHFGIDSAPAAADLDTNGGTGTNNRQSLPITLTAIMLKPDDASQNICDLCVTFTDETIVPTGFSLYEEVDGNFVRGSPIDGNGGLKTGSSDHDHATDEHNHQEELHGHSLLAFGHGTTTNGFTTLDNRQTPETRHHKGTLDLNGITPSDMSSEDTNNAINDPAFSKLLAIQNTSGGQSTPDGIMVIFVGAFADIPSGWEMVSKTHWDRQIKATTTVGEIGDLGGSNTHQHQVDHNHSFTEQHEHDVNGITNTNLIFDRTGGSTLTAFNSIHTHIWTVTAEAAPDSFDTNATTSSEDIRTAYRTTILIKKIIDTCTAPASGDWVVSCADNCLVIADVDLGGNDLILINSGGLDINAVIREIGELHLPQDPNICEVRIYVLETGGIEFAN